MLGPRVGLRTPRAGLAVGVGQDQLAPSGFVFAPSTDATSGKGVPTAAQWSAGGYTVKNLYGFQDLSGGIVDSVGSGSLSEGGTAPSYNQAVSGWTRKGITFAEAAGQRLTATSGVPNAASSVAVFTYLSFNAAGDRDMIGFGTGAYVLVTSNAAETMEWRVNGASGGGSAGAYSGIGMFPLLMVMNRTLGTIKFYTHLEKLTPVYGAGAAGTVLTWGANVSGVGGSSSGQVAYGATFEGTPAEFTDTTAKALLVALGWTPPWS
jgi:hypothetical protein